MMHNLLLEEGDIIQIESVSLPVATFSKFQPQNPDFLDITNPKAVLENALRNFACLTKDDLIAIKYNSRVYELCVLETRPGNAVTIIECDMNVEFAAPVGYKEPERIRPAVEPMAIDHTEDDPSFVTFSGAGNRLDGKKKKDNQLQPPVNKKTYVRGTIPDYNHPYGLIKFDRTVKAISDLAKEEENNENPDDGDDDGQFKAFKGTTGYSLKKNRG